MCLILIGLGFKMSGKETDSRRGETVVGGLLKRIYFTEILGTIVFIVAQRKKRSCQTLGAE